MCYASIYSEFYMAQNDSRMPTRSPAESARTLNCRIWMGNFFQSADTKLAIDRLNIFPSPVVYMNHMQGSKHRDI
jgi:hypothetical protein